MRIYQVFDSHLSGLSISQHYLHPPLSSGNLLFFKTFDISVGKGRSTLISSTSIITIAIIGTGLNIDSGIGQHGCMSWVIQVSVKFLWSFLSISLWLSFHIRTKRVTVISLVSCIKWSKLAEKKNNI